MDSTEHEDSSSIPAAKMIDCLPASDELGIGVKETASSYKNGMLHWTVTDYMRSLKAYLESPPLSARQDSSDVPVVHPTSIPELMKQWNADPVDLLLDLGFGKEEPDITSRIPFRFINSTSSSKGINIRVFLESQKHRMSTENASLYGRFRQVEVLDQVTSAFASLLSDVNTMQPKSDVDDKEKLLDPEEIKIGKRRRVCQMLRKASRQHTLMHQESLMGTGKTDSIKNSEDKSPSTSRSDRVKLVRKPRKRLPETKSLALLTEEQAACEDKEDVPPQSAGGLKAKVPLSAHALKPPLLSSEMPLKDRTRKKSTLFLTKTLKKASGLHRHPTDSFEMEEIQSFEEEVLRGSNLENPSETEITRANSCQSDSSGFLEEPLEHVPLQNSLLPENLNMSSDSSDSQTTLLSGMGSAHMDYRQDLKGSINSTTTTDSDTFINVPHENAQYGGHREEGQLMNFLEKDNSPYHSLYMHPDGHNGNMSLSGAHPAAIEMGEEKDDKLASWHGYNQWTDELFYRVHTLQEIEKPMDGNTENEHLDILQQNVEGHEHEFEENIDGCENNLPVIDPPVEMSVCSEAQSATHASVERLANLQGRSNNLKQTLMPETGWEEILQANEFGNIGSATHVQTKDPNQTSKKTTHFYKSVTIQMSSDLTSSLQNVPSNDNIIKDYTYKCPRMDSKNIGDEDNNSLGLGAMNDSKAKQMKEASSQTDNYESITRNCCLHHRRGTLTESSSVDTGLFARTQPSKTNPPQMCPIKSGHSCHCCCFCFHHHCCSLCSFAIPSQPTCSMPFCTNYNTMELELLRTLKVLQDSMKNISPCTVRDIETMKKSCQTFRDQLVETEQLLFEQQTLLPSEFTNEGREEMRRLQVLRRAVHREVAELECQLDDRSRQTREGILLQLNQLLEEQAKLHSELELTDWREEGKAQHRRSSSNLMGTRQYPQSLAAECSLSEDLQKMAVDSKETPASNQQKKADFSSFLKNYSNSQSASGSNKETCTRARKAETSTAKEWTVNISANKNEKRSTLLELI
ncbi:protein ITPRID1 isoform X2 [Ambystoma mexicanum]|uniref:protein ITPRID1 isoform X2 n=1 Tax=Ambystoma mexicanum TaxID=8296 RepID=UPI0037E8BD5A